jgi:hypothetical protein
MYVHMAQRRRLRQLSGGSPSTFTSFTSFTLSDDGRTKTVPRSAAAGLNQGLKNHLRFCLFSLALYHRGSPERDFGYRRPRALLRGHLVTYTESTLPGPS